MSICARIVVTVAAIAVPSLWIEIFVQHVSQWDAKRHLGEKGT